MDSERTSTGSLVIISTWDKAYQRVRAPKYVQLGRYYSNVGTDNGRYLVGIMCISQVTNELISGVGLLHRLIRVGLSPRDENGR
jgi:hypothetical protein